MKRRNRPSANRPQGVQVPSQEGDASVILTMSRTFSGPLPPPQLLQEYNKVLPGAAERIFAMAEKQQEHRHVMEKDVVLGNTASQARGNYLGFIVAMTAIVGGVWLLVLGRDVTGLILILAPLAALVGVFVYGKRLQKQELTDNSQPFRASQER